MTTIASTFKTDEPHLNELLNEIHNNTIQLPDFQRGWVWDDPHLRSLIASVSLSYPIGAVMMLETGGDGIRFKPRPIAGVSNNLDNEKPEKLILDGQQRLTSLYLALKSGIAVPTRTEKGHDINRVYYLDMATCMEPEADRLDAVISLPEERIKTEDFGRKIILDVSTQEKEWEAGLFPLALTFDPAGWDEWKSGYQKHFKYADAKIEFVNQFSREIWQRFQQYKVPVIELLKNTEKEAVCQVFEKVNTGGVVLSVFELVTATFAADDYALREDWDKRAEKIHEYSNLKSFDATSFLTAVTLLASYKRHFADSSRAVSCKRKDVLKLELGEYKEYADAIEAGLKKASRLLTREKVFADRDLPYSTQLVPLSCICAFLGNRFEDDAVKQKIARWYWCGVFGELYGGANETRFALDLPDVIAWINGGPEPKTVQASTFAPTRLLTLQTRNSAAYKGLMARLMQCGSQDFQNGDDMVVTTYFDESVDIHHIFPKSWCEKQGLPRTHWNSIVNKTPLTSRTNRILGGKAPSQYLGKVLETGLSKEKLSKHLETHGIEPDLLLADDFDGFIRDRAAKLLDLIEIATGKKIAGRDSEEVIAVLGGVL